MDTSPWFQTGLFFTAVAVLVITAGTGGLWARARKRAAGKPGAARESSPDRTPAERVQHAIADLLRSVSGNIETMQDDSQRYGNALAEHRESLRRTATIEDLRELEARLLEQVKSVEAANARYRNELDDANERVARQQRELDKLHVRASIDFLTQLPNRRQLDARFKEFYSAAERYGKGFALIVFDIDHFKRINDTYGHAAGDRVLRAIAQTLDENKRTSDFLARYGGEEFVMLLPETSAQDAERLAERTREKIEQSRFQLQQKSVKVTVSAGVGELRIGQETAEELFQRADKALYFAKQDGRNRVYLADPPNA